MGRLGYKETIDGLLWLDTVTLKADGFLSHDSAGSLWWTRRSDGHRSSVSITAHPLVNRPYIQLNYTTTDSFTGTKQTYNYGILLATTPCFYGGKRWWFLCPLVRNGNPCANRARKLYKRSGYFGCRQCLQLAYPSQNDNHHSPWAIIGKLGAYENQASELAKKIKVPYYKGRPTAKMRRYLQLTRQLEHKEAIYLKFAQELRKGLQL